ncbi:CMD domain protein [Paraburkholderia aromaticivorans]|uniref:CMD domain protein n=1 Tax=Paraburkholderia aromaticivorans TaxID=2026199 RepID=UPI001455FB83|nr:CMD domain protein [Paraburkholderia aromaticivorans]
MSSLPDPRPPAASDDFVAQLAELAPDGAISALRAFRADATRYTQGSHDALFSDDVTDLSLRERLITAWYAALLSRADRTAQVYRERLLALETTDSAATLALLDAIAQHRELPGEPLADKRLAAILAHTEALVLHPATSGHAALTALQAAGLTTRAIVALSQLVAFVTYQVRVVAALRALEAKA